jgi:hypothetical protein
MGEDFLCGYEPRGGAVIEPMPVDDGALAWSPDAEAWLRRVPPFVRKMVRRRTEDHVRNQGGCRVTGEVMRALARKRFGDGDPPFAPSFRTERRERGS